ncbi:holo-ACP synthase [Candidatus Pelagibacter bacterium]|jgi:holo-[acyl-carrier protein] synthase|nr:holo-ACP synthase [Candidatus Pelagibacter bacterium]MDA9150334.1 holo-ACP synthase [Candidatus Pelagibacter sp.]MDC0632066.1 holo-ACP synthase [Candidatus Pelagibacter sp.]
MKTVGIGVDIIDNKRFKKLIKDNKFINRIFSKKEISASKKKLNKINFFSNRFAAKESFAKALGTGFRNKLNFKDIEILNDKLGKPFYLINNKIKQIIKKNKKIANFELFLSISDEKDYSVAFTIIQKI